jgi:hypothetical protein
VAPACWIKAVTSNEPINGTDDGNTSPDWMITADLSTEIRAERSGIGTGRVYTIEVNCADASGNVATAATQVKVPLSKGK